MSRKPVGPPCPCCGEACELRADKNGGPYMRCVNACGFQAFVRGQYGRKMIDQKFPGWNGKKTTTTKKVKLDNDGTDAGAGRKAEGSKEEQPKTRTGALDF